MNTSKNSILIYGAYGYTGVLISELAQNRGLDITVAGRNKAKVDALASRLSVPGIAFELTDKSALEAALNQVEVVIHCAGPFSHTAKPMMEACLNTRTHYLDITGEISVFLRAARLTDRADNAGIMLMPGTGFDVVPSDCLAKYVAQKVEEPTHLELAFHGIGARASRGTATTVVENLNQPSAIRENGQIVPIATGSRTRHIDFGRGERLTMAIPWGDVATAFYSTKIPNIAVYIPISRAAQIGAYASNGFKWLLGSNAMQSFLKNRISNGPPGPTDEQRATGKSILWGEARNASGDTAVARLHTPEGYTLTALAAVHIAEKVLSGNAPQGFQTPASAYGSELIMEIDGVTREDV